MFWKKKRAQFIGANDLQVLYLEALRRELANVIMSDRLETFAKAFDEMCSWEHEIIKSNRAHQIAELNVLCKRYPYVRDFDFIASRHFIRYEESRRDYGHTDGAVERYKEISKYLALDQILDETKKYAGRLYDTNEKQVFEERLRRYKDERLQSALKEAIQKYYIWQKDCKDEKKYQEYADNEYQVFRLPGSYSRQFTPENEFGIFCKTLNEYGVYSFFVADNGKIYNSYKRSNENFAEDHVLDA